MYRFWGKNQPFQQHHRKKGWRWIWTTRDSPCSRVYSEYVIHPFLSPLQECFFHMKNGMKTKTWLVQRLLQYLFNHQPSWRGDVYFQIHSLDYFCWSRWESFNKKSSLCWHLLVFFELFKRKDIQLFFSLELVFVSNNFVGHELTGFCNQRQVPTIKTSKCWLTKSTEGTLLFVEGELRRFVSKDVHFKVGHETIYMYIYIYSIQ